MCMNFFLIFQIKINATNNCNKRHKTKHNQCTHIISQILFSWHKYTIISIQNKHTNIKIVSS